MKTRALAAALVALLALPLSAQRTAQNTGIEHLPLSCVLAGELPLLQVKVEGKGELRGYFRRINTTDWCSVEGENNGPLSRVVLPKFEAGDEIEYFFLLIDGVRVVARSPRIYRVRVNAECETPAARHMIRLSMQCGDDANGIPSSMGAGYISRDIIHCEPP